MNLELRKAERALAQGETAEARVYAWNALATIEPEEGIALMRIADALDDKLLVEEIERRGGRASAPKAATGQSWVSWIFPIFAIVFLIAIAGNTLGEAGPVKPSAKNTTLLPPQGQPLLTQTSGVWLVQLGRSNRVPLQKLADDISLRYRIPVGVLPEIVALPAFALDQEREQLSGDALFQVLAMSYPAKKRATVIGVTDYPIFSESLDIRHPFTLRSRAHYGLVSTAELGANLFARARGHTRYERTRKVVARNIGFLYLRRPVSSDPHSLLRSQMSGTGDIDALEEKL